MTEDYARAIQEERKVLIKAIMKAREKRGMSDAKVKGRFLFINNERYDSKSILEYSRRWNNDFRLWKSFVVKSIAMSNVRT